MFKATPITDKIQDVLSRKIDQLRNGHKIDVDHINRLVGLIISVADNDEEALVIAESMPTTLNPAEQIAIPLSYGQFRLDCKTKEWVVIQ